RKHMDVDIRVPISEFRIRNRFLPAMLLALLLGCGGGDAVESSRTAARGSVLFDGEPLPGGSITLVAADDPQRRVTAMIQSDGSCQIAAAPRGEVRVAVETESLKFGAPAELHRAIPAHYADPSRSQLTATVVEEGEPLRIELVP